MASPFFSLWTVSFLTALLAATVQSNLIFDYDPYQPETRDETVSVGGTVTLTCKVPESDNSSLQWSNTAQQTLYFGEKRALRDNRIQLFKSTPTELAITIGDVQLSDDGEYTCSIFTMPVRTARATVTVLGVPGKPQVSGFEDAVKEGGVVTLTCTSSGSKPPAKLRWFRGEDELQAGRPDVVEPTQGEPTYTVISELTLTVERADDNTMMACAVDHPSLAPGDKRTEMPLRVLFTPKVYIQPENDLPREGEKFHLQCMGSGNPEPSGFVWDRKDGELPPLAKEDGAFLRFETLNKSDNGVYLCQADNGIGSSHAQYTLLVQDLKDPEILFPTSPLFPSSFSQPPSFSPPPSPPAVFSISLPDSSDPPPPPSTSSPSSAPFASSTPLSNDLFPDLLAPAEPAPSLTLPPPSPPSSSAPSSGSGMPSIVPNSTSLSPSFPPIQLNGLYTFTGKMA